jgi:protein-tyrosine phosphatase
MRYRTVTNRILQGGYINADDALELREQGVTDILNLDIPYQDCETMKVPGLRFHSVFLPDMTALLPLQAREVIQTMADVLHRPSSVIYVHCNAGLSRSPTAIWLYLLSTGLSDEAATEVIQPDPTLLTKAVVAVARKHGERDKD